MNGAPLPAAHGAPLRLIAPGWYGVANVKWLTRVEVRDTRLMNRFMARDYVTLREEPPAEAGGAPVWAETSVGRARLKSVPAKVTRLGGQHRIVGRGLGRAHRGGGGADRRRALGAGDARPHPRRGRPLRLDAVVAGLGRAGRRGSTPSPPGPPTRRGSVQPAPDDPWLAGKRTYWESTGQVTRRVLVGP